MLLSVPKRLITEILYLILRVISHQYNFYLHGSSNAATNSPSTEHSWSITTAIDITKKQKSAEELPLGGIIERKMKTPMIFRKMEQG